MATARGYKDARPLQAAGGNSHEGRYGAPASDDERERIMGAEFIDTDGLVKLRVALTGGGGGDGEAASDYFFNVYSESLAHYRNTDHPTVVFFGDSITSGANASWPNGYVSLFADTLQIEKGAGGGLGRTLTQSFFTTGWSLEKTGTNKTREVGVNGCANVNITPHPLFVSTLRILYSKEVNGGSFDVLLDGALAQTVSCNAAQKSYHNTIDITNVPPNKAVTIRSKNTGTIYIEGWYTLNLDGKKGAIVHNVGHGGIGIHSYTDLELEACISKFAPDLTVISHIMNDFKWTDIDTFERKLLFAVAEAKKTGSVLIMPHGAPNNKEGGDWEGFHKKMKEVARKTNVAFISIDDYWGGYDKARDYYEAGQDVHPNNSGHYSIYHMLRNLLIDGSIGANVMRIGHRGDSGNFANFVLKVDNVLGYFTIDMPTRIQKLIPPDRVGGVIAQATHNKDVMEFKNMSGNTMIRVNQYGGGQHGEITFFDGNLSNFGSIYHYAQKLTLNGQNGVSLRTRNANKNDPDNGVVAEAPILAKKGIRLEPTADMSSLKGGDLTFEGSLIMFRNTTSASDLGAGAVGKWAVQQCWANTTANRITKPAVGMGMFDVTLGKPVWCKTAAVVNGSGNVTTPAVWVDATGVTV